MLRWESGEAEFVHTIPAAEVPTVLSDERFASTRRQAATPVTMRLFMDTRAAPFDNLQVRQAVATAIDKEFFARSTGGTVDPLQGIYVPIMPQFEESFQSNYQYDPEAAKALLSEAGLRRRHPAASNSSAVSISRRRCKGSRPISPRSASRSR